MLDTFARLALFIHYAKVAEAVLMLPTISGDGQPSAHAHLAMRDALIAAAGPLGYGPADFGSDDPSGFTVGAAIWRAAHGME